MEDEFDIDYIKLEELNMLVELDSICKNNNINYSLAYGSVLGAIRHNGFIPWDTDIDIMIDIKDLNRLLTALKKSLSEKYSVYSTENNKEYDSLKPRIGMKESGHHKIHVDIFPMVGLPKSNIKRKGYSLLATILYKVFFFKKFDAKKHHKNRMDKYFKHLAVKALLFPFPVALVETIFYHISNKYSVEESSHIFNVCGSYGFKEIISKKHIRILTHTTFEGYQLPIPQNWDDYLTHMYGDYMTPKKY